MIDIQIKNKKLIQKMSNNNQKTVQRQSRKAKTSILFQIKNNNFAQNNIEVGQSMNIISLNTPAKFNKKNGCENNTLKNQNNNPNSICKNNMRRAHQSNKLTIKLGSGTNICEDENKIMSLHNTGTFAQPFRKIQINDLVQKLIKKHLISLQKNKIYSDLQSFVNFCNQFLQKIDSLQLQNNELVCRVKKFQTYFKQIKSKDNPNTESIDLFLNYEPSNSNNKNDRNYQLKILNLQRKVETLNYIIKNYRTNNKEELKQFQKKINEYKPTLQEQLTAMLMQSNKKNQELSKIVDNFQRQCEKYYKDGNWVQIARSLDNKSQLIKTLEHKLYSIQKQHQETLLENQNNKVFKNYAQKVDRQNLDLKVSIQKLNKRITQIQEQKITKQTQYQQLIRKYEELTYKYQALVPLQVKIKEKDETIRRNSQAIVRIQNQNYTLKSKIGNLIKNSQTQIFNNQQAPIETIQQCSSVIQELSSRFCQEIQQLPEVNKQLTSFITHLFQKTKDSFQKIVDQYKSQLNSSFLQNKQLKNRLNSMIGTNKRKYQFCQQIIIDIQNIDQKKKRCLQSQQKIQNNQSCASCMNWILHWGQLNNLFNQMQILVKRLRQID